jgi:two-component sensor histidine kinase
MDIEDIELNINQAIPFALAINEILSNALEHAFKNQQKGKVVVELHEEGDFICSSIHDNGQGMKDPMSGRSSSLGMTLIRALLTQIDADWEIEGEGGVAYTIRFKKYNEKDAHNSLKDLDNE